MSAWQQGNCLQSLYEQMDFSPCPRPVGEQQKSRGPLQPVRLHGANVGLGSRTGDQRVPTRGHSIRPEFRRQNQAAGKCADPMTVARA